MDLFLDPEAGKPLTTQLYEQLRDAITAGRLLPGDQLVPSRQLAGELGVSRHTVTTVYGRLVAEGYAEGRAGGGSGAGAGTLGAGAVVDNATLALNRSDALTVTSDAPRTASARVSSGNRMS